MKYVWLLFAFALGALAGYRGYYEYMDYQWVKYPYRFRFLLNRRIERLEKEGKLHREDGIPWQ